MILKELEQNFEDLKPYEYLHICYYQKNLIQKAASAVFTYLVQNPDDQAMMNNLKFYSSLPEVDMNTIVNFEVKDYVPLYIHGSEAYRNEDFQSVIGYIEESLDELLKEEEECRAFCEGPFDQGWFPDFVSSISNHFTFCLKCKQKCSSRLSSLNGEVHSDLLPSHYHFLQFAYYKVKNLQKACEAVSSYLLFFPNDETMLSNKKFYLTMPKVKPEYFTPRKEAINYIKRQQYEEALLNYIEKEFTFEDASDNEVSPSDSKKGNSSHSINISRANLESGGGRSLFPPLVVKFEWKYRTLYKKEHITQTNNENKNYLVGNNYNNTIMSDKLSITTKKIQLSDEHTLKWRKMRAVKKIKKISERKVTVIMGENELNGKRRFVADGFSQERECQVMLELSKIAAVEGDGYSGNISPHTSSERFEGVTLGRAALLVYFGMMDVEMLELYLNISERGKYFIERYFNTKEELYFTFSHLVCRSSLLGTDLPRNQSHLSHAVHADNCNLKKNGICTKTPPAYTWRDYSAILYLNENFEGGEFFFSSDEAAKHIQSLVKPKCGRLVGFSAGSENLHGVFGVQQGRRCALGLWFTHNPRYVEEERKLAEQVISEVRVLGTISEQLLRDLEKHVVFDLD